MFNASGPTWEAQRKFTTRTLRQLGYAKESMESMTLEEVKIMLDWFKSQEGKSISGKRLFNAPVINSLWRIVSGKRSDWEDNRPTISFVMDEFFR